MKKLVIFTLILFIFKPQWAISNDFDREMDFIVNHEVSTVRFHGIDIPVPHRYQFIVPEFDGVFAVPKGYHNLFNEKNFLSVGEGGSCVFCIDDQEELEEYGFDIIDYFETTDLNIVITSYNGEYALTAWSEDSALRVKDQNIEWLNHILYLLK